MRAHAVGHAGERTVFLLWPGLRRVPSGHAQDRAGIDAWDGPTPIQIKTDRTMAASDHIFWETEKRTGGWASYGTAGAVWRGSPGAQYDHIFCTPGCAIRVPYATLCAIIEREHLRPVAISPTARGYLLGIRRLRRLPTVDIRDWL